MVERSGWALPFPRTGRGPKPRAASVADQAGMNSRNSSQDTTAEGSSESSRSISPP